MSMIRSLGACLACAVSAFACTAEAERPNILWITSEDNAAHWLGCYGNADAKTPRLDALAADGALFTHAYSNAPVCAVARSTILNGAYAVTQGTQHMRSRNRVLEAFKPYVAYLREAGYYCTNQAKTDYNQLGNDRAIWDECSNKAHYKNRPEDKPFFAIFNLTVCHESSLFPEKVKANRRRGIIPKTTRVDPATLTLPPYLPDLPEMRSDFAIYYDNLSAMDKQVGGLLDELDRRGLSDDTIVFYFADHGGPTPRGKRYLKDTGVRIPMLVRCPPKWQHLCPFTAGNNVDELVAFVDLAPTLLSLIGIEKPPQMQGRAFLGKHRVAPADEQTVFLYGDRFDEVIGMRRGITDGRFKYIRRFTPYLPAAPYSYYQFSMPGWIAWQRAWQAGELSGRHHDIWETQQPTEELYDTAADPWEVRNLADNAEYAEQLQKMRGQLRETMADVRDTGLIPEPMFTTLTGDQTIGDYAASDRFQLDRALDLAFLASERTATNLPNLVAAMQDDDPVIRYWGVTGCLTLGPRLHDEHAASEAANTLKRLVNDKHPTLQIMAARTLVEIGATDAGRAALANMFSQPIDDDAALLLANVIRQVNAEHVVPQSWIDKTLADKRSNEYLRRFATRLQAAR